MNERKGGWRDKVARRYGRRATPVDRIVHNEDKASWMQRACALPLSLTHYPFQESSVSVSRNFHNLCGRACGPDRFIPVPPPCTMSPRQVPSFSFFLFPRSSLKALESEGAERGRMTVNHDALSPRGVGGCTKHCCILHRQNIGNDYRRVNGRPHSSSYFKNHSYSFNRASDSSSKNRKTTAEAWQRDECVFARQCKKKKKKGASVDDPPTG